MGTQSTHVDKLSHSWAGYAGVWAQNGIELEGKTIWMHGGGWTVYPCLLAYLLTGKGGVVTVWESGADDQYSSKSVDFALKQTFGGISIPQNRLATVESLRGKGIDEILSAIGGRIVRTDRVKPELEDASIDLLLTGGILEHFRPADLDAFLEIASRIVKPGGWCSHVFDLRDHLYHADKSIPFLGHLRLSDLAYRLRFGHPLGYHNRLLPAELKQRLQNAGFDVRLERRLLLPTKVWAKEPEDFRVALVGIDRACLAPRFAEATDEDLKTAALHFLCQRPLDTT